MGAREVPVESLLAHAAFLRRLAGSLVADPGAADDLVQETFLAAVRSPPEADRPVGGWLVTVLRNVGRKLRRSGGRRDRRERAVARREATPSAEEQVARGEVVREVVDAVFRLDPGQRAVVLMRFYEDLPPREIARRLDVPVNTVKSRLRLALARLRGDLDGRSPSLRGDWRAALVPAVGLGSGATFGVGAAVGAGGVVMGTKATVAVGAVLALGLSTVAYLGLSGTASERAADAPPPQEVAERSAEGSAPPPPAPRLTGEAPPPAEPLSPAGAPPTPADKSAPLPGAKDAAERPAVTRALLATLGFGGKTPPDTIDVVVLDGTTPIDGGAGLLWQDGGEPGPEGIPAGREPTATRAVARDGRVRFDRLADGERWHAGVRLADGVARLTSRTWTTGREENDVGLVVLGDATVAGTVYDETGRPAVGVRVRVGVQTSGDVDGTVAETRTDAEGTYEIGRLPAGTGWVSVAFGEGFNDKRRTRQQKVLVRAASRMTVDFGSRLGAARLTGTLRSADGTAIRVVRRIIVSRRGSGEYVDLAVADDGTYGQPVPPGTWRVQVWHVGATLYGESNATDLADDLVVGAEPTARDFVLPGARIVGRVVLPDPSVPLSRSVILRPADRAKEVSASLPVSFAGDYEFVGIRPGAYELVVASGTGEDQQQSAPVSVFVSERDTEVRRDLVSPR